MVLEQVTERASFAIVHGLPLTASHAGYGATAWQTRQRRDKGNAPTPGTQLGIGEQGFQNHDQQHCQQLATNQHYLLERREKTALPLEGTSLM